MPDTPSPAMVRALTRLAEIRTEQQRQMEFVGVRLGVLARLKELARDERRVLRRIEKLEKTENA